MCLNYDAMVIVFGPTTGTSVSKSFLMNEFISNIDRTLFHLFGQDPEYSLNIIQPYCIPT